MNQDQAKFISEIDEAARVAEAETGIPASITKAQAILESGWGKTELAAKYHNYFGIKAAAGAELYVEFPTREYLAGVPRIVEARFAWYKTPLDSFRAHTWLLAHSPRYAEAMAVKADAAEFAKRLGPNDKATNPHGCGYSTSPDYGRLLLQLVGEFRLAGPAAAAEGA